MTGLVLDAIERLLFHPLVLWLVGAWFAGAAILDGASGTRQTFAVGLFLMAATCLASGAVLHARRRRDGG